MYATAVVAARVAFEDGANTATVVSLRCLFAALAIGLAIRVRDYFSGRSTAITARERQGATTSRDREGATTSRERWIFLGLGVVFAANVYAFYRSVELLKVPLAILTFYVYPLMTAGFSAFAGLDRFNPRIIGFGLLSLVGLALATGAAPETVNVTGVLLALASGAVIAFLLVITTRHLNHVDAQRRTFWMMVSTSAVLVGVTLATGSAVPPASPRGWWAIAVVCVLYAIGLVSLFTSASRIGPLRTALMMNLEPVIAIALSMLVLGQGLSSVQFAGGALVIAGVIGAQLVKAPSPSTPAANTAAAPTE